MSNKPVGGRGHKSPSKPVRVPEPLVPVVELIIENFRDKGVTGFENFPSYNDAVLEAKKLVRAKKSSSESLAQFIKYIYGVDIDKSQLR